MAGTGIASRFSSSAAWSSSSSSSVIIRPWPFSSLSFPRVSLRSRVFRILAFSSNDIKVGTSIEVDGAPWRVLEFLHVKPGKGAAFVRTKMRNYITGNTVEKTFRAGSTIDQANVSKETKQFTYKDGSQFVFMDLSSFEEIRLDESDVGDRTKWLKEGMDCNLLLWNGKVIDLELPITVKLAVVDVDPGLKGDTAQVDYSASSLCLKIPCFADRINGVFNKNESFSVKESNVFICHRLIINCTEVERPAIIFRGTFTWIKFTVI